MIVGCGEFAKRWGFLFVLFTSATLPAFGSRYVDSTAKGVEIGNGSFLDSSYLKELGIDGVENLALEPGQSFRWELPEDCWPLTTLLVNVYAADRPSQEFFEKLLTKKDGWIGRTLGTAFGFYRERSIGRNKHELEVQAFENGRRIIATLAGNKEKSAYYSGLSDWMLEYYGEQVEAK